MKIITLMGADASGKDTQIDGLKKHFESQGKRVQVITIWDSLAEFHSVNDKKSLQEIVETFLLKYEAEARSFFLLACLKNSVAKLDPANDIVFLNGFYQKYWASEMTYGVGNDFWEKNCTVFPVADVTLYLKTPVSECLKRKEKWSKYEQGLGKFKSQNIFSSKEEFQNQLHKNIDLVAQKNKNVKIIDGAQSLEIVFQNLLKEI